MQQEFCRAEPTNLFVGWAVMPSPDKSLPTDAPSFAAWMRTEREKRSWSTIILADRARAIARAAGDPIALTQQTISGFEQPGKAKRVPSWMKYVREAFDDDETSLPQVSTRSLVHTSPETDAESVEIIALDLSLSMGPGTLIEEFAEAEPVIMGLSLIQSITRTPSDRLRLVKGVGDSMEPTLRTGDRVMIDINERQLSRINGLYWIDYHGAHGIKRLRASGPGKVLVISDNPTVENFEVDARELRIEGRVIWFAREV